MGRKRKRGENGKPWFRRVNESWYIKVGGKQVRLVDKKGDYIRGQEREADAVAVWHEMMAKADALDNKDDNSVRLILGLYLERHLKVNAAEKTFREWRDIYEAFCERWPGLLVRELIPDHLRTWWAEHPTWGSSYQNHIGTSLKAALNWAAGADSGRLITRNPLDGMRLPRVRSRGASALISEEDHQKLLAVVPEDLRDVLVALRNTGTRPSNIWRATKRNFDAEQGALVFAEWNTEPGTPIHKTFRKTGESLVVPLTPEVVEMCKRLAERHPVGPLFRTKRGEPWHPQKLASRMLWYKKKLGLDHVVCYGYRHTVATDLLSEGVPDAEVAAILGQKGTDMIYRHYGHLGARIQRLRATLTKNRQGSASG